MLLLLLVRVDRWVVDKVVGVEQLLLLLLLTRRNGQRVDKELLLLVLVVVADLLLPKVRHLMLLEIRSKLLLLLLLLRLNLLLLLAVESQLCQHRVASLMLRLDAERRLSKLLLVMLIEDAVASRPLLM